MEDNLRKINETTVKLVAKQLDEANMVDDYTEDERRKLLAERGDLYSELITYYDNIIQNNTDIQNKTSEYTKFAYQAINKNTDHLKELESGANSNINNLKIQKDNRKRIIEMQRNRLLKYQYIKKTLLYLLMVLLICGVILYIEKLLGKTIKPFSSILLVAIISIFIIFLVFRYVDYNRRSKFNFKQYKINSFGDKYNKTVYEYDRDQLNFMGNSALDLIDDNISQGAEAVKSSISDSDKE